MIVSACLLLMFALVLLRPNSFHKPSYLATLSGALAMATWGFLGVSSVTLDALIGSANWLTLVRDIFATLAFWFYREAVGRATRQRPTGSPSPDANTIRRVPWLLVCLVLLYAIPFAWVSDRGSTSPGFVMDRLEQPAMWLFGMAYMGGLIFLSADALRMLGRRRKVILGVIAIGYILVITGAVIETAYLTLAHLGFGGREFRVSMYHAAELPFFSGIFTIGLAIAWNAASSGLRYRWSIGQLIALGRRTGLVQLSGVSIARTMASGDARRTAFRLLIEIQNQIEATGVLLSAKDQLTLDSVRRRFIPSRMVRVP